MKEKPVFDEYYRLWMLLAETRSAVFKVRHKVVGKYLPPNHTAALIAIWNWEGRISPAILSQRLFLEPHTVSELIKRMQKKGLVTKKKDPERGNIVRISITAKGQEVCNQTMGQELIRGYMSALTAEQREKLREILTVLHSKALKELGIEEDEYP